MPKAKRFLITSVSSEVIIFRSAGGDVTESKCPLCGAAVTSIPATGEKKVLTLQPTSVETDDLINQTNEEEKQK